MSGPRMRLELRELTTVRVTGLDHCDAIQGRLGPAGVDYVAWVLEEGFGLHDAPVGLAVLAPSMTVRRLLSSNRGARANLLLGAVLREGEDEWT